MRSIHEARAGRLFAFALLAPLMTGAAAAHHGWGSYDASKAFVGYDQVRAAADYFELNPGAPHQRGRGREGVFTCGFTEEIRGTAHAEARITA